MNIPDPYTVTIDDDGLSVRVEWNAHYFTDGELQMLRDHTAAIKTENDKLRRLVLDMWRGCPADERDCIACDFEQDGTCDLFDRMNSLGVFE